jgi:hypothetical protein
MARIARGTIRRYLDTSRSAPNMSEQGHALENLVCYLFERLPGISVTRRNRSNAFATEEIDVAFWNEKHRLGLYFLPEIILVECKNWSSPVTSMEVSWFKEKIISRGLTFGILVATRGITGDPSQHTAAHSIVAGALRDQRRLVIITGEELARISDTRDLITLLKEKLCELAVSGTIFPAR